MSFLKQNHRASGVSAADPSAVFVIKSLLNPVVAVLVLAFCLALRDERLQGPYFLIAVLGFAGAAEVLGVAQVTSSGGWRDALQQLADLALRWVLFTACVWLLIDLSALGDRFDDRVLLTWGLLTPLVAWGAQLRRASRVAAPGPAAAQGGNRRRHAAGPTARKRIA